MIENTWKCQHSGAEVAGSGVQYQPQVLANSKLEKHLGWGLQFICLDLWSLFCHVFTDFPASSICWASLIGYYLSSLSCGLGPLWCIIVSGTLGGSRLGCVHSAGPTTE